MPDPRDTTIVFTDQETNDEACAIVRTCNGCIALALSHRTDGDIEAFLLPADAARLVAALQTALRA
jgi:hypothetical protein